jgi:hypothetical protein
VAAFRAPAIVIFMNKGKLARVNVNNHASLDGKNALKVSIR